MPQDEAMSYALLTAENVAVEIQDQLIRLPKLMPAAPECAAEFKDMVRALHDLRDLFMRFEGLAMFVLEDGR